jgi:caspase 7
MECQKLDALKVTEPEPTPKQDALDSPIDKFDLEYNMNHTKRGKALIFSHWKFERNLRLPDRDGTDADCTNLSNTLSRMNFDVSVKKDLTYAEMSQTLREVSAADHTNEDCLLVAVLSHGASGGLIYAKDRQYQVDDLWGNFTVMKSPTLAAKPKIFLIQACRGEKENNQGKEMKKVPKCGSDGMQSETDSLVFKIPNYSDFVIMFSTMPDFVSWRNTKSGTWLVDAFCKTMDNHGYEDDFLSLLTRTCHKMITEFEWKNVMQTGCVTSMLTRKIFFKPKTDSSKRESN